jgi:RimJ/RimL family protein N-acetyltransferase
VTDPRLTLRQVRVTDCWTLFQWRNSERIRLVSTNDAEIPRDEHVAWFERRFPEMRDRTVIVQWDTEPVGWFQLEHWDETTRSGEWGVGLGVVPAMPGLGGALVVLALGHAFERADATEMTARALGLNTNMLAIMRRLGFTATAGDPLVRADGSTTEVSLYSVTREDWPGIRDRGLALLPSAFRAEVVAALAEVVAD